MGALEVILALSEMRQLGIQTLRDFEEPRLALLTEEWATGVRQSTAPTHFDIFLSHAYADKHVVIGVYRKLSGLGFVIYIDWIHDPKLNRTKVTPKTAELLRTRMRQCDSLFYLTTDHASYSKWMPWETGYFDAYDRTSSHDGHVAILPVLEEPQSGFAGQEYLGLYCWADVDPKQINKDAVQLHSPPGIPGGTIVNYVPWINGTWP